MTGFGWWRPAAAAIALLLATYLLAWAVERHWLVAMDEGGLRFMAGGPAGFWRLVSDPLPRIAVIVATAIGLLLRRRFGIALWFVATVLGGIAFNSVAKGVVTRSRPGLLPHLEHVDSFSFPSGHSAGAITLGLTLALIAPPRWRTAAIAAALAYALLVGLSRMGLAVHWPSDVAAGWLSGAGWTLAAYAVWRARST